MPPNWNGESAGFLSANRSKRSLAATSTRRGPGIRDGSRSKHRLPPPHLGQHTNEVLRELGYSEDRMTSLQNDGAVIQGRTAGQSP
jgi:hypothetical protein